MVKLTTIESEFDTTEQADAHDEWLRAKVAASLSDGRPVASHATVMTEIDEIIDGAERRSRGL